MKTTTTYYCDYIVDLTAQLKIEASKDLNYDELKQLFTKEILKLTIGETKDINVVDVRHFDIDGDEL